MGWSAFRKTGLTFHNPGLSVKGYTLFTPSGGEATYLINMTGQVVKRWQFDDFSPSHPQLLSNGHLLISGREQAMSERIKAAEKKDFEDDLTLHFTRLGGGYSCLREYDFDGNLIWSYENPAMHHDFLLTEEDHLLLPTWTALPDEIAKQVRGGVRSRRKKQPPMLGDDILEIDRDGNEISRCHTWQLFDPRRDPIRPLQDRREWTHMNSIDLTADKNFIVSCRNNSKVAIIDREAQAMTWKLGPPEVSHQHHATHLPNGNIQIFDNGMNKPFALPSSRIIEVDPKTSKIEWEYKGSPPQQFYSGHISGVQRLSMGNVLICEGTSGRLFEVTRKGEVAWEWITPFVSGKDDGSRSTWIYRAYRYRLEHPAVADQDLDPDAYRQLNAAYGLA